MVLQIEQHLGVHSLRVQEQALPFHVQSQRVGWIKYSHCQCLQEWPHFFEITPSYIQLKPSTFLTRTAAMRTVVATLQKKHFIPAAGTNQLYRVGLHYSQPGLFEIDTAAIHFFGIETHSLHLNVYYEQGQQLWLWIAVDQTLKNLVSAELYPDCDPDEHIKHCAMAQANILPCCLSKIKRIKTLSYLSIVSGGIFAHTLYLYDLKMKANVFPLPGGDHKNFVVYTPQELIGVMNQSHYTRGHHSLALIDFFMRHNFDVDDLIWNIDGSVTQE